MEIKELYHRLDYVNHSREKRQEMANLVVNNPELIKPLLDIAFDVDKTISSRACWVLEFTTKFELSFINPYLDYFTENLGKVHLDSSVRPIAKICEYLVLSFYSKTKNNIQEVVNERHLERITTACFDWLISDQKVAAKAYSMTCLFLLGKTFDWVHPELRMIIEQNYDTGSAAYKARGRMILKKLK